MSFATGLALAVSLVLGGSNASANVVLQPMPQAQSVEQYVDAYFTKEPIMIKVAECESHFHQYASDGSIFRGVVNSADVGVMQINEHYHAEVAKKLGLDLYSIGGNVAYAQYLYEREGTAPWSSSQPCWGKTKEAQALAIAKK
jgi:hypothetical protein